MPDDWDRRRPKSSAGVGKGAIWGWRRLRTLTSTCSAACAAGAPRTRAMSGFYCARGKSAHEVNRKGCICVDCENFKEFALSKGYYCAEGSAEQIGGLD